MTEESRYYLALHAIGWLSGEDAPHLALALLESGASSPSLCELASWRTPTLRDASPLLEVGLRDEGIVLPEYSLAVATAERETLRRLAAGTLDPRRGAHFLWSLSSRGESEHGQDFVGIAFEWDDHPEARAEIEADIRELARMHWTAIQAGTS